MTKRLPILPVLAILVVLLSGGAAGAADGTVLQVFTTADGLPNNWVKAVMTPPGKVVVTAGDPVRGGTAVLGKGDRKFSPYEPGEGFAGTRVTSWAEFGGKSYVATEAALNVGEGGKWNPLTRFQNVMHSEEILVPAGNRLYAIAPVMYGGILRLEGGAWSLLERGQGMGILNNATGLATRGEEIFISTTNNGLFHFDGKGWKVVTEGLPVPWVTSVAVDGEGTVWLGTPGGLGRYEEGKVTLLRTEDGLPSNKIAALQVIRGKLVVGTMDQGVSVKVRNQFINTGSAQGLSDDRVTVIAAGEEGAWVGTLNGLNLVEVR